MKLLCGWILCALIVTIGAASPAGASSPDSTKTQAAAPNQKVSLYPKLEISPSVTTVIFNSNIRVDASNSDVGTEVDAESDLGLEKNKIQPRIQARWRPGHKHEIEGGYQFAERNADKTLSRDISFRDTTFHVGANIHSVFNTNLLFLNYRYAFIAKERTQAGVGLGLGAFFFKVGIDALASSGGGSVSYSASDKVTVPVGSLGLYGRFLTGSRWYEEVDARLVKLRIDRFHIRYGELNAAGRYYFSHKTGIELGGGIDAVKVDIDPKFDSGSEVAGPSSQIKFSLSNVRLGFVYVP